MLFVASRCVSAQTPPPSYVRTYDTVFEMASSESHVSGHKVVNALGYHYPGDGGGGLFVATNTMTLTNTGTRIYAGADGYSWERIPPVGDVNTKWFGAIGDGRKDDSAAIQATINSLSTNGGVVTVSGLSGIGPRGVLINGKSGITIQGSGPNAGFKALARTTIDIPGIPTIPFGGSIGTLLGITNCNNIKVTGLEFDGNSLTNSGIGAKNSINCTYERNYLHHFYSSMTDYHAPIISVGGTNTVIQLNRIENTTGLEAERPTGLASDHFDGEPLHGSANWELSEVKHRCNRGRPQVG